MYCEKCGQEIPDHATFCGKCGAKVRDTSLEKTITEQTGEVIKEQQGIRKWIKGYGKNIVLILVGLCLSITIVMGCRSIASWNKTRIVPISKAKVGSNVVLGSFEQDNDLENGTEPIEWIVLDKQGDKLLLLSKKVLDSRDYYGAYYPVTWEESHLRFWLNSVFYANAFTQEEQQRILQTEVENEDNPDYGTNGGNDTEDDVFLLSIKEVKEYLPDNGRSEGTAYAMDKGLVTDNINYAGWWLRSPGSHTDIAAYINYYGGVDADGNSVDFDSFGVRPALWVSVEE